MITEDYVSFEVAKLLKEKGFNEKCRTFYNDKTLKIAYIDSPIGNEKPFNLCVLAPTHQRALKWLREIHKYLIVIGNKNGNYLYLIKDLKANKDLGISNNEYIHYEGAVEAAIKYCLTNLI